MESNDATLLDCTSFLMPLRSLFLLVKTKTTMNSIGVSAHVRFPESVFSCCLPLKNIPWRILSVFMCVSVCVCLCDFSKGEWYGSITKHNARLFVYRCVYFYRDFVEEHL